MEIRKQMNLYVFDYFLRISLRYRDEDDTQTHIAHPWVWVWTIRHAFYTVQLGSYILWELEVNFKFRRTCSSFQTMLSMTSYNQFCYVAT